MSQFAAAGASAVSPFATADLSPELLLAPLTSVPDFASEDGTSNFKSGSKGRRSGAFALPFTAVCVVEPCAGSDPECTTGGADPAATGSTLRRRVSSSTQRYIVFETPSSTRSRSSIASRVSTSK
jgi:hypothetical protein